MANYTAEKLPGLLAEIEAIMEIARTNPVYVEAVKYFECGECGKLTRQFSNFKTHVRSKHYHLKDIHCPHTVTNRYGEEGPCTFTTGDPSSLSRHRKHKHGHQPRNRGPHKKAQALVSADAKPSSGQNGPAVESVDLKTKEGSSLLNNEAPDIESEDEAEEVDELLESEDEDEEVDELLPSEY
ncbi:hypothetical protein K474DRAFT_1706479 [Panus rudis PR-1116 ss-1]|nr:hypothetical protein K474DRAFT_1706479 [Panus rudis PR-1116 ss-1]